jgi:hypothetical protein
MYHSIEQIGITIKNVILIDSQNQLFFDVGNNQEVRTNGPVRRPRPGRKFATVFD